MLTLIAKSWLQIKVWNPLVKLTKSASECGAALTQQDLEHGWWMYTQAKM